MKRIYSLYRASLFLLIIGLCFPKIFVVDTSALTPIPPCFYHQYGDANCDDSIDLKDFNSFREELMLFAKDQLNIKTASADFNNDLSIDLLDFNTFRKGFIASREGTLPTPTPVITLSPTITPSRTVTPSPTIKPSPTLTPPPTQTPTPTTTPIGSTLDVMLREDITFATQQLNATATSLSSSKYPQTAKPTWSTTSASSWTSGFLSGSLWNLYRNTTDATIKQKAETWMSGIESQKGNTSSHDVGFIINNSFGNGYKLTNNTAYKSVNLTAANSLASRYSSIVGCTRSWDSVSTEFKVIIDNMMNIELLFWASKNGGDQKLYDMAVSHATKTMQNHMRADGSVYQLVIYNPTNGAVISKGGTQSYSNESTWARGQAWAIYGFTMTYRETKDSKFLDAARKAADYYIKNIPTDKVPYWDFNAPKTLTEPRDSSAAAIAASGLLELSKIEVDQTNKSKFKTFADETLKSLSSSSYLAKGTTNKAILLHGTYNKNKDEFDSGTIWGDYYFLEAINRYFGKY
jgi:hypothetical protein